MLLNGGELEGVSILSRKTVQLMMTNQLGTLDPPQLEFRPGEGFGLGGSVGIDPADELGWAASVTLVGPARRRPISRWIGARAHCECGFCNICREGPPKAPPRISAGSFSTWFINRWCSERVMILVAGSANLDFVVQASHIPAPGETVLGREFKTYRRRQGRQSSDPHARVLARQQRRCRLRWARLVLKADEASLLAVGVQMHMVRVENQPTGTAFICVPDDAENAITVTPGANNALRAEHLPSLDGCNHLLLQLETPIETVIA